jgi:hypothetical protein
MLPIKNLFELAVKSLGRGLFVSEVNLRSPARPQANSTMLALSADAKDEPFSRDEGSTARLFGNTTSPEGAMDAAWPEDRAGSARSHVKPGPLQRAGFSPGRGS